MFAFSLDGARQRPSVLLPTLLAMLLAVAGLTPSSTAAQDSTVVSIRSQEADSGAAVDVPVDVSEFTQVGSVSLIITYDPELLSFPEDPESGDLISDAVRDGFRANVTDPGELRISWFDASGSDPINLGEGKLLEITFSEFAGDTTEVRFGPGSEVSDSNADPIDVTFEGGTVTLDTNEAPEVGVNEGLTLKEGGTATISSNTLSASDPDNAAADLTFDVTGGPDHGAITVGGDTASAFTQADLEAGEVAYSHDDSETTADSFTFDLTDPDGAGPTGQTFAITIEPVNDAPTITALSDTTIEEDTSTDPIGFTVGDDETAPSDLSVTASTSNPDLVPSDSIEFGGSGADRTVTVTPTADSFGTAVISVTVTDRPVDGKAAKDSTQSFELTVQPVNDPPTVATNEGLTLDEGSSATIPTDSLSATDVDDAAADLTFDVTDGPDHGAITVGGDTASAFTQADLEAGAVAYSHDDSETTADSFTFDLTDADGEGPTGQTFAIAIEPVDDAPTISGLADADTTIEEDTSTDPIGFTVGDDETAPSNLAVTDSTDNPDLIESIEFGGSGADRTVTVTPAADSNGTADITVTVENGGQKTASQTFTVTVEPVNDAPVVRVAIPDDTLKAPGPPLQLIDVVQTAFRDPEGDALTASSSSSDPSVVAVEVTGEGTLAVIPEGTGAAEVTLTASDGEKETSTSFMATVEQRPEGEPAPRAAATAFVDTTGNGRAVDFGDTGMKVVPFGVEGGGPVRVAVFDSGPDSTDGISEENVSAYRAVITAGTGLEVGPDTEVRFPVSDFGGIDDPTQVTMYSRPSPGRGAFTALSTTVDEKGTPDDSSDDEIVGTTGSFSEFVLASDSEPLPVELVSFTAQVNGSVATLRWETASETNNAGFEVKHRGPGQQRFSELGFVESKGRSGTTGEAKAYRFRAEDLSPGTHEFRLRQVDLDGSATLLDTVSAEVRASRELALKSMGANPVRQSTRFAFTVEKDGRAAVVLYNVLGQQVKTLRTEAARVGQRYTVEVPVKGLSSGVYFVRLEAPSGQKTQRIEVVR